MFPSGLIVSIQPRRDSAFKDNFDIIKFAYDCEDSCVAYRIEGANNIENIKENFTYKPLIGLSKKKFEDDDIQPVITPLFADAKLLLESGSDYVAMECSGRTDFAEIDQAVKAGIKVIADVADVEHAILAEGLGCVAITTALYGYIGPKYPLPGTSFVRDCIKNVKIPVIAEGGYFSPYDVLCAKSYGAHSICIGTAIHDPRSISKRFAEAFNGR